MSRIRVIPVLLLEQNKLVKTIRFSQRIYVGDPINAVKIFNEKEVDELAVLDISASVKGTEPPYSKIEEIAGECFMPLSYGGGINNITRVKKIFDAGVEKIIINSAFVNNPSFVEEAAKQYGSQSIVVSIDVKKSFWKGYSVFTHSGKKNTHLNPIRVAQLAEQSGAGEIFLNSIDNDGMYSGYDVNLIKHVSEAVKIPVIACGGARNVDDFVLAVKNGASAVAAGSMFVFYGPHRAVLINYPSQDELQKLYLMNLSLQ
jgi:cyclase